MMTGLDWLKKWNQFSPVNKALIDGETGQVINYSEFYHRACKMAFVLRNQFQIKHGDRVAILSLNELEYVVLFFALQRLGAILVPINYRLTQREVNHIVGDCNPSLIVYQSDYETLVQNLPPEIKPKQKLLLSGTADSLSTLTENSSKEHSDFEAKSHDPAMIIYTSGTTGSPKGAVLSLEMIFWNSLNTTLRLNISQTDATVIFLPFFHTGGWNVLTTPFIHRGAQLIFLKKFDADQILNLSEKYEASILFGVPTTMDMMSRSRAFDQVQFKKMRYAIVGGEPMPLELIHKWHSKGIAIRQGYGLTEFGPNVFSLNEEHALTKIGSIGFPNFYCEAKIVDANDREVSANEVGELLLKGPMAMMKYWNNAQATADVFIDGWLRTGDLAKKDQDNFFYIVGRKKDMFKSGGENVYPVELEKIIRQYPGIREAAVVGVPDEKWGEVGKAFISLEASQTFDESGLREHCLKNLAKFKVPKYFQVLQDLPKGDSGKILKRSLR